MKTTLLILLLAAAPAVAGSLSISGPARVTDGDTTRRDQQGHRAHRSRAINPLETLELHAQPRMLGKAEIGEC